MPRTPLRRRITAALVAATTLAALSACNATGDDTSITTISAGTVASIDDTHADPDDGEYDAADATTISLADGASTASGSSSDAVTVEGDTVTITAPGTYVLSGELSDGQVVVDSSAEGKVLIVLDGVDLTSSTTSPLVITAADEAVVILADGSTNTLADSAAAAADDEEDDAPTATLFSMADLTIAGSGQLTVTGASNDGIASKDGLVILGGTLGVTAVDDGIRGKDYLVVEDGTITVDAGGDGLKADNESTATSSGNAKALGWFQLDDGSVAIDAGDDGIDAVGALNVADGSLTVASSVEGLEAAQITLVGGDVDVTASEDGLNATAGDGGEEAQDGVLLTISGGDVLVTSGMDGLDSNGDATITGGSTVIDSGARGGGDGSIDVNGVLTISGGSFAATGGLSSAPSTDSTQAWVAVELGTTVSAGQEIALVAGGTTLATQTATRDTTALVLSVAGLTNGTTYDVQVDGVSTTTVTAGEFAGGRGGMGGTGGGPQGGGAPPQ
ncbi:carbohydrate-binding domain-containing protein [Nocardioides caeni]|uniref:Carbohydrate-binding domain-containing protein n=1 Tax=Nocardioides caeni TaxID=574700 RepID=A0A4S8NMU9_9ACTN|nr:carbohydrate-binding domain-containing protein [Nocardioides caeni]THV18293.1 carbohydrate-binding domain-containing protein [Nocardioides caeni]